MQALRMAIIAIRESPKASEPRRMLRALASEQDTWATLAILLGDEARAATDPIVQIAFYEELADVCENLDRPEDGIAAMEAAVRLGDRVDHHERLAWLYRRARKWEQAAASYERVADLAEEDRAYKALRAAARLYRDNGRAEPAAATYRAIVARRPTDLDAWRALDELYGELGRWDELADVRAELAGRTDDGLVKATHLRAQARALETAGKSERAATITEAAEKVAPETLSGIVDAAFVLARAGKPRDAAKVLEERVAQALAEGAPLEEITALRNQLAAMLEDACGDRAASAKVLEALLADAPGHLPALERLVWQASHDPEPRVHAIALVKLAAATPHPRDKLAAMRAAGAKFREAKDWKSCVKALEKALELAAGEAEIEVSGELASAKAALRIEIAKGDALAGNDLAAEVKLRSLVDADARNVDAATALAEVYQRTGRLETARELLDTTLATAPEDVPASAMAALLLRNAAIVSALGDDDHAHQMLVEAQRLARRELPVVLAFGESCFARRLWREAAIHLGGLAEHPDAARYAKEVAVGLVKAAQAEIRGLRPANAARHFDAALRLDPNCAPALHALAEQAIEKGDTVRGVDLLEREATVTTDPEKRLRLFHALGDLCLELLGDEARAMACFAAAPDDVVVLDKLLTLQRARALNSACGETCVRLAGVAPARARDLLVEALRAFSEDGDLARGREIATPLVAAHPGDAEVVELATSIVMALGDFEQAKLWLRPALTMLDKAGGGAGDARRAELWRRLGDAERVRDNERGALAAYQRAVAMAPDSPGGIAARRGQVELAAKTGASIATSLTALVEAEQDPMDTLKLARALASRVDADPEDVRTAYELAGALGAPLSDADEKALAALPEIAMASDQAYGGALDEAERAVLIDDDDDAPIGPLCELVWAAAAQIVPAAPIALARAGAADAKRLSPVSDAATASIVPQIAKLLGGPAILLHAAPKLDADLRVLCASPPVVLVGPRLASVRARSVSEAEIQTDASLRFKLGRIVELTRPRRVLAALGPERFTLLIRALTAAFAPTPSDELDVEVEVEAERLRAAFPVALRKKIAEHLAKAGDLDPARFLAACERAADRAGLVACGHVDIAIELCGGAEAAPHLVRTAGSQRYLFVRKKLRPRR